MRPYCPRCNSDDVRPSQSKNRRNIFKPILPIYRCRWCCKVFARTTLSPSPPPSFDAYSKNVVAYLRI